MIAVSFTTTDGVLLAVVIVLIILSAAIAVAETAITRISRSRAAALEEQGHKRAGMVIAIIGNFERSLNAIYLVALALQTVQAAITGIVASRLFGTWGVVVATIINVVIVFIIAEAAPKTWALQHTDRATLATAPLIVLVGRMFRWIADALITVTNVILPGKGLEQGPFVTEEEIIALMGEAAEASVIEEEERDLIESIIDFGDTVAREIMVPRTDMVSFEVDYHVADCVEIAILNGLSRFPVYRDNVDDVVGIVYAKDLMRAERDQRGSETIEPLMRTPHFVPETKRVAELLREMQTRQTHIAIVVDEYGGTAGLVTMEDLLEELVGDIADEFDQEIAPAEVLPGGEILVHDSSFNVDDLNDRYDLSLPEGDWDSLGGLVFSELGRVPVVGDIVRVDGYALEVQSVDGRRVGSVKILAVDDDADDKASVEMSDDDFEDFGDDLDDEYDEDGDGGFVSVDEFFGTSPIAAVSDDFRSGFVSLVGRPNVGKSTLLNRILGRKVSIVSDKPQTTRNQIRGVLNRPNTQVVFVDTPGIHKPRTLMGERLNDAAIGAASGVDVVRLLVDATAPVGRGDAWVAERVPPDAVVIVNKCDLVSKEQVMKQLLRATDFDRSEYFPISAATGEGVDELVAHLISRLPVGPQWYPDDMVTDVEEAFWVAELVREKLLAVTHDELPHSIACRVTEWEWPRVRVEILVERESQKGIVIGKKGAVLKQVGISARAEMPPGAFLELHVKVDKDWQRRPKALDRLGY